MYSVVQWTWSSRVLFLWLRTVTLVQLWCHQWSVRITNIRFRQRIWAFSVTRPSIQWPGLREWSVAEPDLACRVMKKIFGKIDTRRQGDEKENEKAHSSFIGKKYVVGKHTVIVEVKDNNYIIWYVWCNFNCFYVVASLYESTNSCSRMCWLREALQLSSWSRVALVRSWLSRGCASTMIKIYQCVEEKLT